MTKSAAQFWDERIAATKHLRKADTELARACCEAWDLYSRAYAAAKKKPLDKETRISVNTYCSLWKSLVERLALDPLGRVRADKGIDRDEGKQNPLGEFGIVG